MSGATASLEIMPSRISIVIPVHNGADVLRRCLESLREHAPAGSEIIVVDDGSQDGSADVAKEFTVKLLSVTTRGGPSAARNQGSHEARGELLIFFDADVCVKRGTIEALVGSLADSTVGAVFGSYDARPDAPQRVSRFRNLLHHYVHQTACVEASTFWTGCGAVRRKLFAEVCGFDPGFRNSSVEDIDFGLRLRRAGHRVVVNKSAQVTHLKRWTLKTMCTTDLFQRGVPWSRLILRERRMPNDLNVKISQRLGVVLTFVLVVLFGFAAWYQPWMLVVPFALAAAIQTFDNIGSRTHALLGTCAVLATGGGCIWAATRLPTIFALGLAATVGILLVNRDFYRFLSRNEGTVFAVSVVPLHLLYFFICGVAFMFALGEHVMKSARTASMNSSVKPHVALPDKELT